MMAFAGATISVRDIALSATLRVHRPFAISFYGLLVSIIIALPQSSILSVSAWAVFPCLRKVDGLKDAFANWLTDLIRNGLTLLCSGP